MPVIVFASTKGGCGKTTCAVILGSELAQRGASVTIIDADPNRNVADWAKLPGVPAALDVVGEVTEETIVDAIEDASRRSSFVIADLEGSASLLVSYAVAMADLVLIPCQGSQMDARQAGRTVKLVGTQSRIAGREIPFALVLTRTDDRRPHPASHRRKIRRDDAAGAGDADTRSRGVQILVQLRRHAGGTAEQGRVEPAGGAGEREAVPRRDRRAAAWPEAGGCLT
jgi:cellulose biosynthesis protein BcsQ